MDENLVTWRDLLVQLNEQRRKKSFDINITNPFEYLESKVFSIGIQKYFFL